MRFIKKGYEYRQIYSNHKRIRGSYFTLLWQKNEEIDDIALGLIVSSKVGNAVMRNKIKRRMRAYLREISSKLKDKGKGIVIAQISAAGADWNQLCADLSLLLKTSGAYA